METSELIRKVRKVEIKTRRLSDHIFCGSYHSSFKGRGMSFSEVRAYSYGDDVRQIDWNVTARTGIPHIKVFEEERELSVLLVADMSQSAYVGSSGAFRREFISEICAVLAFSAMANNDKVGLLLFTEEVERYFPPKKGRRHILRLLREILQFEPARQGTSIRKALEYANRVQRHKSICFLLSDFLDSGYEQALRITARRHDLIGICCRDPWERMLPDTGLMVLEDAETGVRQWIDTSDPAWTKRYTQEAAARRTALVDLFRRNDADCMILDTDRSYIHDLVRFFAGKARQR